MAKLFYRDDMSYEAVQNLQSYHPSWKLLNARRAPMILSFLYNTFVVDNNREIPEYRMVSLLSDYLEMLALPAQEEINAKEMLTQWAEDSSGWLRKFYPADSDEVHYDLTSAAQKAIEWVESLKQQTFIGTESRLLMVFQLFHEIVEQSDDNPERRLQELERRKAEMDEEIAQVRQGNIRVLAPVQIKERYLQAMQMSREILADFRAVEQNFRNLRHSMQEKSVGWDKGKGALLKDFFQNQTDIQQSEQGKSFQAFLSFLMSRAAQDDFEQTIREVGALEAVKDLPGSKNAHRIIAEWISGSNHVQDTLAVVSEQLRRYVDENFLLEERRIHQIIKNIEAAAIALRHTVPQENFVCIDALCPKIELLLDRPLFTPPAPSKIAEPELTYGDVQESDDCALYTHLAVDKNALSRQIDSLLQDKREVSLAQVVEAYPIRLGLAELIGYLSLAQENEAAMLQTEIEEPILWQDADGNMHKADFCRIVYRRSEHKAKE